MATLSDKKKQKILKTFQKANLGEAAVKGTGLRQKLFQAFQNNGAQGVLNRINKYRTNNGNEFGKINYNGKGKLTLKKIKKSISDPEQLARDLNIPIESFDEAGARAGQDEMKQYFAARTADQQIGYDRQGQDINTNENYFNQDIGTQQAGLDTNKLRFGEGLATNRSRFGEDIGTSRNRLAASQAESERGRALTESGENINQNNALASANIYDSPAADNLKRRLMEIQGLRRDTTNRQFNEQGQDINTNETRGNQNFTRQEQYGNQDFTTQQNALNTTKNRGLAEYSTQRTRLGEDTSMFAKERERQLQELLGSDIEAKREKFYNQQALPSSSLNLNARY